MRIRTWILAAISSMMLAAAVNAQTTGVISGRVTDASTGDPLPSASVQLRGTRTGVIAGKDGVYRLENVPTGSQTVVISYIGYDDAEITVRVPAGGTIQADAVLESDLLDSGEVLVKGLRVGQVRALNQQKTADNIKNVVDSDLMGRFPDPNVAEALQRVPAISVQRDQGEGRYVLIRGMEARLNSVTVNGDRIPSPEGEIRSVALDVIPADIISSIEVNKALTPDMDADAIGGSINLVTKSARDYGSRMLKGTVAGGYNDLMSDGNFQGSFTYGDALGPDRKLGVSLTGNYYRTNRGSDNDEFEYEMEDFGNGDVPVIGDFEIRDYAITRTRLGMGGTVDYSFSDDSRIYLRSMFSQFDDDEIRRALRYRPAKGDFTGRFSAEDAEIERTLKDRFESQRIINVAAGGEHLLNVFNTDFMHLRTVDLDYQLSYSYAHEDEPNRRDMAFVQEGVTMNWSAKDSDFPKFNVSAGDPYDPSLFEFDEFVCEDNLTTDRDISAMINAEMPFTVSSYTGALKFGGKFRNKNKERTNDVRIYDWDGDDDLTLDQLDSTFDGDKVLDDRYTVGASPDPDKVKSHYDRNRSLYSLEEGDSHLDTDPANYEATENIAAAYGQGKINIGNLMLLGGLRIENTSIDYTGNRVIVDADGDYESTREVSNTNDYLNAFPMIHARYRLTEDTNIRAAITTSIARPDYYALVPYQQINREDEEIEQGNPELDPTRATNIDLLVEHYIRPVGIVSGGFFYKQLDDYIYYRWSEQSGGPYNGFEVMRPVNGESATLYGVELNWQHQLTFLPGVFDGLGVYANYTWVDSEAEFPGRTGEKASLPGQAEHIGNMALSYEKFGFSGRVSLNFHGKYIDQVGETSAEDIYYDDHAQLDISMNQRVHKNISLFLELVNLTDEPLRYYQGESSLPIQNEYYGFWSHAGIKFEY